MEKSSSMFRRFFVIPAEGGIQVCISFWIYSRDDIVTTAKFLWPVSSESAMGNYL
jgi:hypothetical protein